MKFLFNENNIKNLYYIYNNTKMSNFLKFFGFIAILAVVANSQIFHPDSSVIERFKNWVDWFFNKNY